MKMKFKITYEWENEIDFENYNSGDTSEEAMDIYEQRAIEDYYSKLNDHAWNILPSGLKGEFIINWGDGAVTKCSTE